MRWLQSVLIALLVLGQVHLCETFYALPDGQVCSKCPTLLDREYSDEAQVQAAHGDCHDCCVLKACDNDGHAQKAKPSVFVAVDACLAEPLTFTWPSPEIEFQGIRHVESAPTHGPPPLSGSRGPPCFQLA